MDCIGFHQFSRTKEFADFNYRNLSKSKFPVPASSFQIILSGWKWPTRTRGLVVLSKSFMCSRPRDRFQESYSVRSESFFATNWTTLPIKIWLIRFCTHQSNRQQQLLSKTRAWSLANFLSLDYWKVDVIRIQTHLIGNNEHKCRNQIFWINHLCCCSSILLKWYRNLKTFYKVENFNEFGKTAKIKKRKLIQIE